MPIYEYYCSQCKAEFELTRPFSQADAPASCPQCGGAAQKLLSVFASKLDYYIKVPEKPAFRSLPETPAAAGAPSNPEAEAPAKDSRRAKP
ncbi:MAG: zinc ribbon domain-containing protein [Chloroflexi bacterium]|nr:zinc ribbon domain-containing protein [Chloroflexota bacterium]